MKKFFPYIIGGVVLVLLIVIMMSTSNTKPQRNLDERMTLRQTDKIPYGTRVARELLASLYPDADVSFGKSNPERWNNIELYESNQAVILIADYFDPERDELTELSDFVKEGNYVFIISRTSSDAVASYFDVSFKNSYFENPPNDSLQIKLMPPAFATVKTYTYPGVKYEGAFNSIDTGLAKVLGQNEKGDANFIQMKKGKGSFFIHTVPLAFSNYFILHKKNAEYYQQVFSVLPKNISAIHWNEYFLTRRSHSNSDDEESGGSGEPNYLGALLKQSSFKWGLLIAAVTLFLFLLLGMRRRQRMIPVVEKPKNDSLDFVKTLGRLYYDRRDHKNLTTKMTAYFLEHVRSRYKVPTHTLDDTFIASLHFKSGYPEQETRSLVNAIHDVRTTDIVSDQQLTTYHKQLEAFYQNT